MTAEQELAAIIAFLIERGDADVREVAMHVLGEPPGTRGRSQAYQRAYRLLRLLETHGAAKRTRVEQSNPKRPLAIDRWSAVAGAPVVALPERRTPPPSCHRTRSPTRWRTLCLTERLHLVLLGVLNDAVIDDPHPDLETIRNLVADAPTSTASDRVTLARARRTQVVR